MGFVSGIISQDHDLQQMYFDNFLKIACLEGQDIVAAMNKLEKLSNNFDVDFILSISMDERGTSLFRGACLSLCVRLFDFLPFANPTPPSMWISS